MSLTLFGLWSWITGCLIWTQLNKNDFLLPFGRQTRRQQPLLTPTVLIGLFHGYIRAMNFNDDDSHSVSDGLLSHSHVTPEGLNVSVCTGQVFSVFPFKYRTLQYYTAGLLSTALNTNCWTTGRCQTPQDGDKQRKSTPNLAGSKLVAHGIKMSCLASSYALPTYTPSVMCWTGFPISTVCVSWSSELSISLSNRDTTSTFRASTRWVMCWEQAVRTCEPSLREQMSFFSLLEQMYLFLWSTYPL